MVPILWLGIMVFNYTYTPTSVRNSSFPMQPYAFQICPPLISDILN